VIVAARALALVPARVRRAEPVSYFLNRSTRALRPALSFV
jgi:hypothetical protein